MMPMRHDPWNEVGHMTFLLLNRFEIMHGAGHTAVLDAKCQNN